MLLAMPLAIAPQAAVPPVQSIVAATGNIRRVVRQTPTSGGELETPAGMIFIPGGETIVGTDVDDVEKLGQRDVVTMSSIMGETPQQAMTIDPFHIDRTEVTNAQWKAFLDATGGKPSKWLVETSWIDGEIPEGQEDFPVTNVNIPEINEYLAWAGKRLPSEFEWVRAARGDDRRAWPWGDRFDPKNNHSGGKTVPIEVGGMDGGASPYGVLNMAGNVFEWTSSSYRQFDGFRPMKHKQGRKEITVSPSFDSSKRVIKGGAYISVRYQTRIDFREGVRSSDSDAVLGFRAARSVQPALDAMQHAYARLLPPQFSTTPLNYDDMFGREVTTYDDSRNLVTDFRYLAFAPRGAERGARLGTMKRKSVDEPVPVGVIASSEDLVMTDMPPATVRIREGGTEKAIDKPYVLPAGAYAIVFKGAGESKAYKAARRERRNAKDDEVEEGGLQPPDPGLGAAVPWPGSMVFDIIKDVDFPQDEDLLLYYSANNVVVGWQKADQLIEQELGPIEATGSEDGREWAISFTLNNVGAGKKMPRFTMPVTLFGEGL